MTRPPNKTEKGMQEQNEESQGDYKGQHWCWQNVPQLQLLCSVPMARKKYTHMLAESLGSPPGQPRCVPLSSFPFCMIRPVGLLQFAVGKRISEKRQKTA